MALIELGVVTETVNRLVPSVPVSANPENVAIPDSAFLMAVPESTAPETLRLT